MTSLIEDDSILMAIISIHEWITKYEDERKPTTTMLILLKMMSFSVLRSLASLLKTIAPTW